MSAAVNHTNATIDLGAGRVATCVAFSHEGTTMAIACTDGTVHLWDVVCDSLLTAFGTATSTTGVPIKSIVWSSDGVVLFAATLDGMLSAWDVSNTAKLLHSVPLRGAFMAMDVHPTSSDVVAVAVANRPPFVVQLSAGVMTGIPCALQLTYSSVPPETSVEVASALKFSHATRLLHVATTKGNVFTVDVGLSPEGVKPAVTKGSVAVTPGACIQGLFSATAPTRDHLLALCTDNCLRMVDAVTLAPLAIFTTSRPGAKPFVKAAVSGTGTTLAAVSADNFIHYWNLQTQQLLDQRQHSLPSVTAVAFDPTRQCVVTANAGGRVTLWATVTRERWSEYARIFEHLETNVEYVEAEDEYDVMTEVEAAAPEHRKDPRVVAGWGAGAPAAVAPAAATTPAHALPGVVLPPPAPAKLDEDALVVDVGVPAPRPLTRDSVAACADGAKWVPRPFLEPMPVVVVGPEGGSRGGQDGPPGAQDMRQAAGVGANRILASTVLATTD